MKSSMKILLVVLFGTLILSGANVFASEKNENLIAVGQGISMPASTSTINYSKGLVISNPVGTLYQNGGRLSFENDQSDTGRSAHQAYEAGYAGEVFGGALGYSKRCGACEAQVTAAGAVNLNNFGIGLSMRKNLLGLGALYGVREVHRWGVMLDMDEGGTTTGRLNSYGFGYTYVQPVYSLTLDLSRRDGSRNDDTITATPGVALNVVNIQLSINDKILLNKEGSIAYDSFWFGLGTDQKAWALSVYSDYANDYSFVLSAYF
jgi:hypothetical protein